MISRADLRLLFEDITHSLPAATESDVVRSADLYTLDDQGHLQIAKRRKQSELEAILRSFNHELYCYAKDHTSSEYGSLSLLSISRLSRCGDLVSSEPVQRSSSGLLSVQGPSRPRSRASSVHHDPSINSGNESQIDLKGLRRVFDECRKTDSEEFGLNLKKREPHCHWACTRYSPKPGAIDCLKFSYGLVVPDGPSLTISHHFHVLLIPHDQIKDHNKRLLCADRENHPGLIDSSNSSKQARGHAALVSSERGKENESRDFDSAGRFHAIKGAYWQGRCQEMARGFTTGLNAAELETILRKTLDLEIVRTHKRESKRETTFRPMLHPKAILLGVLENFEADLRSQITPLQKFIHETSEVIKEQRQAENKDGEGLVGCSILLCESNVSLGLLRPKEKYLTTALEVLESCKGIPQQDDLAFFLPTSEEVKESVSTIENPFQSHWTRQLNDINARILDLKVKCENCRADLETLQHRVSGTLTMVSNLISQRENDWIHDTEAQRIATAQYQVDMLKKQSTMLEKQGVILEAQEIIAKKAKTDGTVTKYIAVLTALLLPATFVAILFTVPIFKWDDPDGVWIRPEPFRIYWKVTGSMTGAFVAFFLSWFAYLECRDKKSKPPAEDD